jgi:hypothetical protein
MMKIGMSCPLCVRVCVVFTLIRLCFPSNWHLGSSVSTKTSEDFSLDVITLLAGWTLHPPQVGAAGWTYKEGHNGESCQAPLIFTKTKTKLCGLGPLANYTDRATAACWRS